MSSFLLDSSSWNLNNAELIEQIASLLSTVKGDECEEYRQFYSTVLMSKIIYELYTRLTATSDIETLQIQCVLAIVDFIKMHPRASDDELTEIVDQKVKLFKAKVQSL